MFKKSIKLNLMKKVAIFTFIGMLIGMLIGVSIMLELKGLTYSLILALVWSIIEGIKIRKPKPVKHGFE